MISTPTLSIGSPVKFASSVDSVCRAAQSCFPYSGRPSEESTCKAKAGHVFFSNAHGVKAMQGTILIDGYNVLHSPAFHFPLNLDLEGQRDHLIRLLYSYADQHGVDIIVVFDSSLNTPQRQFQTRRVRVVFSKPNQEADAVIRQYIRQEPHISQLTVVSSDQAIRFTAYDHGARSLSSEEFCRQLFSLPPSSVKRAGEPEETREKYEPNLSDQDIQEWMELFNRDDSNEI